jgi:hypothetical protein
VARRLSWALACLAALVACGGEEFSGGGEGGSPGSGGSKGGASGSSGAGGEGGSGGSQGGAAGSAAGSGGHAGASGGAPGAGGKSSGSGGSAGAAATRCELEPVVPGFCMDFDSPLGLELGYLDGAPVAVVLEQKNGGQVLLGFDFTSEPASFVSKTGILEAAANDRAWYPVLAKVAARGGARLGFSFRVNSAAPEPAATGVAYVASVYLHGLSNGSPAAITVSLLLRAGGVRLKLSDPRGDAANADFSWPTRGTFERIALDAKIESGAVSVDLSKNGTVAKTVSLAQVSLQSITHASFDIGLNATGPFPAAEIVIDDVVFEPK